MDHQKLYTTIFVRRSVRNYQMAPLPDTTLSSLRSFLAAVVPLDPSIRVAFDILKNGEIVNPLSGTAPHYLCFYSEQHERSLLNAGFILQQADLFLSSRGLGSCWLGVAKPLKRSKGQLDGLPFVTMLSFGKPAGAVHRAGPPAFKRKSLSDITSIKGADDILEAARLAPSASNSQPWYFCGSPDEIIVCRKKLGLLQRAVYDRLNQIDVGIALFHLVLALDHASEEAVFDFSGSEAAKGAAIPAGFEFVAKIRSHGGSVTPTA